MTSTLLNPADSERLAFSWERPSNQDAYIHFKIRRTLLIAALVSLLIHALLFFAFRLRIEQPPISATEAPLSIQLNPAQKSSPAKAASKAPVTKPQAEPKPEVVQKPIPKPATRPREKAIPRVNVVDKPSEFRIPATLAAPTPPTEIPPKTAPPTDMMSLVNANRARREAAESAAASENAEAMAGERKPGADEIREANIQRNLKSGANGIFQILHHNSREATFSFRGWTSSLSNSRLETYQVEVGKEGDIEHAIIRKIIELIRRDYNGDFYWESRRLGRSVQKSARLKDSAELENFLMQEFREEFQHMN